MKRILLIDDEKNVRESICDVIEAIGHQVEAYSSIDHALTNSDLTSFDVVICDIGLPDEDAFQFTTRIKRYTNLVFILLSAFSEEETIQKGMEAGADHYLVKPTSIKLLSEAINSLPNTHA